jgi:hypothetical protein
MFQKGRGIQHTIEEPVMHAFLRALSSAARLEPEMATTECPATRILRGMVGAGGPRLAMMNKEILSSGAGTCGHTSSLDGYSGFR